MHHKGIRLPVFLNLRGLIPDRLKNDCAVFRAAVGGPLCGYFIRDVYVSST
jgi:hypothetical protein